MEEAVKPFNAELLSLYGTKPPVSKAKMASITRLALKGIKYYKHIVHSVEKFISKCRTEYKIPGLYVIDAIVRQSRHHFGAEKDVYAARFSRHIKMTFFDIFKCTDDEKSQVIRVLNLWQKKNIFSSDVIQPLFDLADPNSTLSVKIRLEATVNADQAAHASDDKKDDTSQFVESTLKFTSNPKSSAANESTHSEFVENYLKRDDIFLSRDVLKVTSDQSAGHDQGQDVTGPLATMLKILNEQTTANADTRSTSDIRFNKRLLSDFDYSDDDESTSPLANAHNNQPMSQRNYPMSDAVHATLKEFLSNSTLMSRLQTMGLISDSQVRTLEQLVISHQLSSGPSSAPTATSVADCAAEAASVITSVGSAVSNVLALNGGQTGWTQLANNVAATMSSMASSHSAPNRQPSFGNNYPRIRNEGSEDDVQVLSRNSPPEGMSDIDYMDTGSDSRRRPHQTPSGQSKDLSDSSPASSSGRYRHRRHRDNRSADRSSSHEYRERSPRRRRRHRDASPPSKRGDSRHRGVADGVSDNRDEWQRERQRRGLPPVQHDKLSVCSTTLWVGHLSRLVSEEDLSDVFGEIGVVESIDLIRPRGCAFIKMDRRMDAAKALERLYKWEISGKAITLAWAPGKGMKDKAWKDYWDVENGVSYIPFDKLCSLPTSTILQLEEGGNFDDETVPGWLKTRLAEERPSYVQEESGSGGDAMAPPPPPLPPANSQMMSPNSAIFLQQPPMGQPRWRGPPPPQFHPNAGQPPLSFPPRPVLMESPYFRPEFVPFHGRV